LSEADISEIERISKKKSVRKISNSIIHNLNRETLATLIASFLVLKAHGHADSDLIKYLATNRIGKTLKLGLKTGSSALPSILTDSELRSLILKTRAQMNKQKQKSTKRGEHPPQKRRRIVMLESATRVS
jgi:hypothetical protein